MPFQTPAPRVSDLTVLQNLFEAARAVLRGAPVETLRAPVATLSNLARFAATPAAAAIREAADLDSEDGDADRLVYHNQALAGGGWWVMSWVFVADQDVGDGWPPMARPLGEMTRRDCLCVLRLLNDPPPGSLSRYPVAKLREAVAAAVLVGDVTGYDLPPRRA